MRREQLLHILLGAMIALALIVPLAVFAYVRSGLYNVGASRPHTKFTEWITHETMIHSVRGHARSIVAPASSNDAQVKRGFCQYETHCVACHGASAVARGLAVTLVPGLREVDVGSWSGLTSNEVVERFPDSHAR